MAELPNTGSDWRTRWAARENAKRQNAYRMMADGWSRRNSDLASMRSAAVNYQAHSQAPAGVLIDLRRGEAVYHTIPAAQMIEAPQFANLPAVTPDLVASPAEALTRPLPEGIRLIDAGTVVVTDRRVVFLGARGKREWAYAKLAGLLHDRSSPYTLMHVVNRQRISGLYLPSASAPGFRFNLALALADARKQRPALIAQLDGMLAQHRRAQPAPPALVTPAAAPATARIPGGMASIAAMVLFALCAFGGVLQVVAGTSAPQTASPNSSAAGVRIDALPVPSVTPEAASGLPTPTAPSSLSGSPTPIDSLLPTTTPTLSAPTRSLPPPTKASAAQTKAPATPTSATAPAAPTSATPPATRSPKPKPTTASPTPKKVDLCGAPQNPYGYNFCGGSYIYSPASGVCSYFRCIDNFFNGKGYLIQCNDGMVSMSGGRRGACSYHDGVRRPVYK
ncbi:hypothetical protein E0H26_26280 [Micromonospora zingiberis]|uniref:Uncharacterized protein n=1 Tax=Micromonospora zingiberis TaxID=2053011 RepID=A0A4R0G4P2_9ACTN|nr:hypothetical protein [Micromonospora zingiberis]TCB90997.1 hypothetical protein E0H26_26280 [Micromonospora zingiberis]